MAKIYQYDMKVPFDMSDVNGFIKMPQLIPLVLASLRHAVDGDWYQ